MALPTHFKDNSAFFASCVKFLHENEWIYNYPNTHILVNKIFEKIPPNWISYFSNLTNEGLNNLAFGILKDDAPLSMQTFFKTGNQLTSQIQYKGTNVIESLKNVRISQKKMHEIINLVPEIHNVCQANNITHIIDIGSGLGHLPQLLHERYGYKILGIEANKEFVIKAHKLLNKNYESSIKYAQLRVTKDSAAEILKHFYEHFNENIDKVCLVALHACADLTVDILTNFASMHITTCAVIMPCCYHRLEGSYNTFTNFPLSKQLLNAYQVEGEFLTRPFLRLACQQTNSQWRHLSEIEHRLHARNCLYRNALEEIANKESIRLVRQKRKTGCRKGNIDAIEYISGLSDSYHFFDRNNDQLDHAQIDQIKETLRNRLSGAYAHYEQLFEALSALQAFLQNICENLILYDRCVFLNEFHHCNCNTIKITDDQLSPRCYALVARKISK